MLCCMLRCLCNAGGNVAPFVSALALPYWNEDRIYSFHRANLKMVWVHSGGFFEATINLRHIIRCHLRTLCTASCNFPKAVKAKALYRCSGYCATHLLAALAGQDSDLLGSCVPSKRHQRQAARQKGARLLLIQRTT